MNNLEKRNIEYDQIMTIVNTFPFADIWAEYSNRDVKDCKKVIKDLSLILEGFRKLQNLNITLLNIEWEGNLNYTHLL